MKWFLHFSFVKKASLRTENVLRNMIIFIMCINVTILNLNAVKVTVQTNLNEQNIGFTNVVSYFFLLILGWNTTQTCIWQVLWGWPLRLSDISISDSPLLRMVDSTHSHAVFFCLAGVDMATFVDWHLFRCGLDAGCSSYVIYGWLHS